MMLRSFVLFIAGGWALPGADVQAFLATYCLGCHGSAVQMADRRFDMLRLPVTDDNSLILTQDIIDQLNLGQMPPAKARQPGLTERTAVINALTAMVADGHAKRVSTGSRTVLRRLNRREYLNTVGDLFRLNMTMFNPTAKFPRDQTAGNMDNIGDTLVTSGYLLEQYLDAADQVVEKALDMRDRPEVQTWSFTGNFRQQPELDYAQTVIFKDKYLCLYESMNSLRHEGAYAPLKAFSKGVPVDGFYEIRVKAEAMNRRHPYNPKIFQMDPEEPYRMGIVPGNEKAGPLQNPQPIEPQLAEVTLGDNGPEWHTMRVWLDAGYTPRFTFPNGMIDGRRGFTQIIAKYRNTMSEEHRGVGPGIRPARPAVLGGAQMPHVRIHEVHIRGPFHEQWPPASRVAVLGDRPYEPGRAREVLQSFATRAYRRPLRAGEVDRLMAVVESRRKDGKADIEALKDGLKAALCSPAFLYLAEPDGERKLTPEALASRLSYFLWSTMPDAELRKLAADRSVVKPEVLVGQATRMLKDARSEAFVQGLLDSWLNLRSLGDMPPDRDAFESFYSYDLQAAMKRETSMFTRDLLDRNGSVVNFLDSDYTFVNKPLAKLYGMDEVVKSPGGQVMRMVKISNPIRGGLLGQGAVLTVSANGVETSPVTRGVWLLDNILGTPPAPPPDNVPPIDPDIRGAKTMREILSKHRASATCMACHQKIDPPGFALENFNPVGEWRDSYKKGVPVDASGEMNGKRFENVAELKKILVERKLQFARMLTERVLSYACGRRMEPLDRPQVNRIADELATRGYGFRDLVELVVASDLFRSK